MSLTRYLAVKGYGKHEYMVQKSRFIAQVNRAEAEDEAQDFIERVKKEHRNANHNCSAYIVGKRGQIQKASDNGEPVGTAGVPILEVLKKRQLKEAVIVVTRYFGGIKLGTGGLIRAYGRTATGGLNAAGMVKRELMSIMHATVDYERFGKIENQFRHSDYKIKDIHYLDRVSIETYIPSGKEKTFTEWMKDLTNGKTEIVQGKKEYFEEDVQDL